MRSVERVVVAELSLVEREHLAEAFQAIAEASLTGECLTREWIFQQYLSKPDMILGLMRGDAAELVGFVGARITHVEHEGQRCAVFSAAVFCRLSHRGGRAAARFGLLEALRFRLRQPGCPLAYMALAVTPAPYVLHARTMRRVHPRCGVETPAHVDAWMHAVARTRGLEVLRPGVVAVPVRSRDPSRLERSRSSEGPDATFYARYNPNWTRGEAMLVWVPLDLANVLASLLRGVIRA